MNEVLVKAKLYPTPKKAGNREYILVRNKNVSLRVFMLKTPGQQNVWQTQSQTLRVQFAVPKTYKGHDLAILELKRGLRSHVNFALPNLHQWYKRKASVRFHTSGEYGELFLPIKIDVSTNDITNFDFIVKMIREQIKTFHIKVHAKHGIVKFPYHPKYQKK